MIAAWTNGDKGSCMVPFWSILTEYSLEYISCNIEGTGDLEAQMVFTSLLTNDIMMLQAKTFILGVKCWLGIFIGFDLLYAKPAWWASSLQGKLRPSEVVPRTLLLLYVFLSPVPASSSYPLLVLFSTSSPWFSRALFHWYLSSQWISHCTSTRLYSWTHLSFCYHQGYSWKDGLSLQILDSLSPLIPL